MPIYSNSRRQNGKGRGRPPIKGKPHKKLSALLKDRNVQWKGCRISLWYGRTNRRVEFATGTALWYHAGLPPVPIRWLLVRDPSGELDPQAFLATDLNASPKDILTWFVSRWQVEVTFEEVRAHLGVETQRQWTDQAILRTTPALLGLFSIITLWTHDLAACSTLTPLAPHGTQKPTLHFPTPSPPSDGKSGINGFIECPRSRRVNQYSQRHMETPGKRTRLCRINQ